MPPTYKFVKLLIVTELILHTSHVAVIKDLLYTFTVNSKVRLYCILNLTALNQHLIISQFNTIISTEFITIETMTIKG